MTCDGVNEGRECGTPPPTTTPTTPPVTQDPTNPTDKTDEQKTFENIMHVIGEKLDGIKDAITGGNQNQNGGDTGGSNGGDTGGDVNVNVDMSETNAKIDETNSLIDELTKWLQGEDLGDDIFGDSEPPEKELTPQQLDTSIFSSRSQCPADARLSFNLLGGKSFTKTFEFKDWCDNLEIFGSLILIASYLFGAYIIVSKS
ncbi:virulence factor TspB C-terminal domain-related protein [Acinetobacter johnsonii]|nr:virulence factor TspB C-terminal domain-related protein [Acinetobacter johnsonii]